MDLEEKKWLYEEIVEHVPPFKWLRPDFQVLAQLLLVETVGILAFLYFQMPLDSVVFGTLAIIYTVVWSSGCLFVIPWLRRLKNPTNEEELDVLASYKNRLLCDRKYELAGSVAAFIGVSFYLFILEPSILARFLGIGYGNPILVLLILILTWDIAYRLWLSFLTTSFAAKRSISLARAARGRRGLEYTAYSELQTLKSIDWVNLLWVASAVLLLPIATSSPLLTLGIIAFLGGVLLLSVISFLAMETIPWFPPDVESILYNEKFAYASVCTKTDPHTTPVIFVYDGRNLYFATSVKSAKYRYLRRNNRMAVLVDMRDRKNVMNNRTLLMQGTGTILGEISPIGVFRMFLYGLSMLRVRSMFTRKYPKYTKYYKEESQNLPLAWQSKPLISRVLVRLEPQSVTYWREARPTSLRV
ncbi:MAG: pyridoxamine 5'-phosphate oxidase family protein [Candidatus Thorarchaeota archaeon]